MKIVAWTVTAFAGLGTLLYVHTGLTDTWASGFLAAPLILLFAVPMLFSAAKLLADSGIGGKVPALYRGAPIGMGTVVSVGRTGLSVNDQPQLLITLDVDTQDGRRIRAEAKQIVDLTDLAAVQPGSVLPVRYLPGNGRVVLATDAPQAELQAVLDRIQLAKGLITPRQLQIAEQGLDTRAVVLAMAPTGEVRGERAVARLDLRVSRPDGTAFDLSVEKALAPVMVPRVQPGAVVRVRYLAQDESDLVILAPLQS
ncbi:hypothetical protein JOF53_005541 [Crossiella equi]|uniref:Uncharacterized protein n=1 Tax=Crossiella equi TaxID=130796 RepID=A0ABS5AJC4_9PSEU|nr:hypothetical protein [Crossiella equi]MBP2476669.1 hypothetical protein [Crossiella equi]